MPQFIRETPYANPLTGLSNDVIQGLLGYMKDKQRTQQMQGLASLLESTGIPKTVERVAYAESPTGLLNALTNVNRANVPLLKPETADALMTLAPVPSGANKAAMTVGRAGERYAEKVVPQILERGGLPAQLLRDLNQGSRSNAIELGSEFLGKNPPKIENLARTSDKFLFHSSTADKAKDLKYGVEPQAGGDWVREVASGATNQNLDDFFENVTPLAWFSDKPEWIKAMVGRKLNKPFDKVTAKDIEEHGHLAFINKKSPEAENITYIPEQGLMEGSQSVVYDINKANPRKAWETGLYQEGNYGSRLEPFGVERNEYVSPESVEPLLQLTGPELVQFMRLKGLLETAQPKVAQSLLDTSYKGSHTAPNASVYGATLDDLTKIMPADVYTQQGKQLYGIGDRLIDSEWRTAALKAKGKPDAEIEIYRAVPKGVKSINSGDWVTTSPTYAKWHGENVLDGDYEIIKQKVKAKTLSTEGYPYEFGYNE